MGFAEGFSAMDDALSKRAALNEQVRQRNQELISKGYNPDDMSIRPGSPAAVTQGNASIESQKINALQQQLKQSLSSNATRDSDAALLDHAKTGDASNLNKALTSNPQLAQAWGAKGVQNVSNIDYSHDQNLLANAGITPTMYDTPEKQSVLDKNLFKVYNGKDYSIGTAQGTLAETGAINRPGNSALIDSVHSNHQEMKDLLHGPKVDPTTAVGHKYEDIINTASDEYNIPPNVLSSMIHQESSGNANAKGPVLKDGERSNGLMGLKDSTAKELGVTNMYDPRQNIYAGAKYLRQMLDKYQGNMTMALAAYNAGPGAVDKWGGVPPYGETQNYVAKISANLDQAGSYTGHSADSYGQSLQNHYQMANPQDTIDKINAYQAAGADAAAGLTVTQKDQQVSATVVKDRAAALKDQSDIVNSQIERLQKDKELSISQQNADTEKAKLKIDQQKADQEKTTTTDKDNSIADQTRNTLYDLAGGQDAFMKAPAATIASDPKAKVLADKIERLTNTQLSSDDKKDIQDTHNLVELGAKGADIYQSTGPVGNFKAETMKSFGFSPKDAEAADAFNQLNILFKHGINGSTLTPNEEKITNEVFGKLGDKAIPLLKTFKTTLEQVQAKLNARASFMDPAVAKIRVGADQEKLANAIATIDKHIQEYNGVPGGKPLDNVKGVTSSTPNPSDIAPFGGNP